MAKSSPEHITALLTNLRSVHGPLYKQSPEQIRWQNGLYIEALQDIDPLVLSDACKRLIKDGEKWPKPADIRKMAMEIEEHRSLERSLSTPTTNADIGATMRNEAILLLGMFRPDAQDACLDDNAWKQFLAEAARVWGKVRPQNGLRETDAIRSGRAVYGFALEAWARWYLRMEPVHQAYVMDRTRQVYREMTGREIETHNRPVCAPDLGLGRYAMQAARVAAE
jgi:hypothetical protein